MFAREILRAHANSEGKSRSWLSQAEIWHNETVIIPWSPLTSQSTTAGSSTPTLVFALASSLTTTRQPHEMDLNEIRRCDEHPDVDFSDEKEIARFVRPRKWFALDIGNVKVLRINVRLLFVSRTWTIQRNTVTRSGHPSSCTTNSLALHTRLASRARVLRRKYKKRQTSLCHMPRHMPYSRPTSKARDHDPDPPPSSPPPQNAVGLIRRRNRDSLGLRHRRAGRPGGRQQGAANMEILGLGQLRLVLHRGLRKCDPSRVMTRKSPTFRTDTFRT